MKYVSDRYAGKPNEVVVVPDGGGFDDMIACKGDKEIGDRLNKIIARLAEENDLKGVIDQADFNDESYGTGIPACILVIDKQNARSRTGIFLVDASRGFAKDGAKNRLRERDIHRIVDVFARRREEPRARQGPKRPGSVSPT